MHVVLIYAGEAIATKLVDGTQKEVKAYKAGDYFGELSLLTDQPRAASVVAKGALTCASLGRKPFTRLVGRCDDILARNQELYDEINATLVNGGDATLEEDSQSENAALRAGEFQQVEMTMLQDGTPHSVARACILCFSDLCLSCL